MRSKRAGKDAGEGGKEYDDDPEIGKNVHAYNAEGAPEEKDEEEDEAEMKRGGRAKRKAGGKAAEYKGGGKVDGKAPEKRMDRVERGAPKRHRRSAGGGTPYTSGANDKMPEPSVPGRGHESTRPSDTD